MFSRADQMKGPKNKKAFTNTASERIFPEAAVPWFCSVSMVTLVA